MCTCNVPPEAQQPLADLLADLAAALCPEDPRSVVIGPVDLGNPDPPPNTSPATPPAASETGENR